ncbi:uncharacterized protein RSE6_12023 [Rhynchosporium secalis]|uniref:Uncharacterized protein n=1 Tax=Rhynchosporium secalis TaxID=38038 RepID=A0A1E1MPD0_RHYSE|nr:uncharacterized protein RSE6_12023 [Rhynchosporium secalis]
MFDRTPFTSRFLQSNLSLLPYMTGGVYYGLSSYDPPRPSLSSIHILELTTSTNTLEFTTSITKIIDVRKANPSSQSSQASFQVYHVQQDYWQHPNLVILPSTPSTTYKRHASSPKQVEVVPRLSERRWEYPMKIHLTREDFAKLPDCPEMVQRNPCFDAYVNTSITVEGVGLREVAVCLDL